MSFRLGFDIGGTFTDFVIQDEKTGEVWLGKTLTTPKDPSIGVMNGLHTLLSENGVDGSQIVQAVHATTLATNVVIERKGERIALLTTRGFRDILEFQRQKRYDLYDFYADKPVPLVPRHWILEVEERVAADGSVIKPLDEEQVRDLVRQLMARNVNSIAVSLLHSYRNPDHERRLEQIIKEESPQLPVSISSDVSPVIREYERTNTTVVNAYTMPAVREYLRRITAGLNEKGYFGHLYVMQSNGGIATSDTVQKYPARIIESGPAAGALGAAHFGKIAGYTNLISFDMGGTTAKICLVEDSKPGMTNQFEIDR
ncbi:MAG: hydantoinase/oxoprolinase family protein, partial [Chloroflexi bacterium]|nr:hydantoinase/oxoprolinase family protein [Chloroflexota bacterium]